MVWMGNPDEFEAVTADGLLEPSPSPSPDSEEEWNRRNLKGKNRRELGKKGSCGKGKGKKGSSCEPWKCINEQLIGNGFDYDGDVAQTKDGRSCKTWSQVVDGNNNNYASSEYGFGPSEQK